MRITGALVAALSRNEEDAVSKVVRMLDELKHRGSDAYGVAAKNTIFTTKSIKELRDVEIESDVAVGHNFSRILPLDEQQPVRDAESTFVFEGRFFPLAEETELREVERLPEKDPLKKARLIVAELDGSYAFVFLSQHRIIAGRDPYGQTPLYYGGEGGTFALASERKALWRVGIRNVKSFPPGNLGIIDTRGVTFRTIRTIVKPAVKSITIEGGMRNLEITLLESVKERTRDLGKVALAFSGGLDSSIIALMAKRCGLKVQLISVGIEGQPELEHAENIAGMLDLPIHVKTFAEDDVHEVLPTVLWLIEEPEPLKTSIAIPIYWTAETASGLGYKILLFGQGSDELFGGYHKYLREYCRSGIAGVERAIYHDVTHLYEVNFERDNKMCFYHKVEPRLPFVDWDLILFSLCLPVELKIESPKDTLRKRVLRQTAKRAGLPHAVYARRKKAIQYSTGVEKVLSRLAKDEGLRLRKFIGKVFQKVYSPYYGHEPK